MEIPLTCGLQRLSFGEISNTKTLIRRLWCLRMHCRVYGYMIFKVSRLLRSLLVFQIQMTFASGKIPTIISGAQTLRSQRAAFNTLLTAYSTRWRRLDA